MLLSRRKQFVFLHIPKTAGTSVMRVLLPYARFLDRAAYSGGRLTQVVRTVNRALRLDANGMRHLTGFHKFATAQEVMSKMGESFFDFYRFSFVRNPFDWVVSIHAHLRRLPAHPLHEVAMAHDFSSFLEWGQEHGVSSQHDALCDAQGKLAMSDFGRVESIDRDLPRICAHLKIPCDQVPHANANAARAKDYRSQYNDRSRELVQELFALDLSLFGYDFDGLVAGPGALPRASAPMEIAS